ncbi:MAG: protein kinase [Acidobacteriota bacterium]|nr:protein kinase [Acidobacteriota bacterium]
MRDSVGSYRLLERTGGDRLGDVHRARDTARGRTASVRLVHPAIAGDPASRAALTADATRAAALSHPALAALFDVIDEGDVLALAHEHVEGKTLAATLGGTALNPRVATAIAIQIADGLADLHASGLSHGSVDAEHIVINPRGQAKLIDAGLIPWLSVAPAAKTDDVEGLGELLLSMTGRALPAAQWATDLKAVIARTRPGHAQRFQSTPTLAAELRSVAAMLEARADAAPPQRGSGGSVLLWLVLAVVLLVLGGWFLFA